MTRSRLLIAGYLLALSFPAMAQSTVVPADTVTISGEAVMPSIADNSSLDNFKFVVTDAQIKTTFDMECTGAGRTEFLVMRKDRKCAFGRESVGAIYNPNAQQWLPRNQYTGSYTVTASGLTVADTLAINYTALGVNLPAVNDVKFGGSLNLKPEQSSSGGAALQAAILGKLGQGADGLTNSAVDTIDFNRFVMPSAGLPQNMDPGVTWTGNAAYSYQTYSWYFQVTAEFAGKTYPLTGNMPFTGDSESEGGVSTYNLVLTLPTTQLGTATAPTTFDDLFADAGQGADLFATADGITGTITMDNTRIVETKVDESVIKTPSVVTAEGSFKGQGVPIEVTRSFVNLIALLPATFFGP